MFHSNLILQLISIDIIYKYVSFKFDFTIDIKN